MSLKSIAEKAVHSLGAVHLIRQRSRANARILMYHRFQADSSRLAEQCEHLSRHYHSISLTELADAARANQPLPPNSLAITVDDGYRDFQHAFPVFQRFGLKVTLYVVSGFAAGELWLWPDQLLYLFENAVRPHAEIPMPQGSVHLDLSNPSSAFSTFSQTMIAMTNADRLDLLQRLPALLEVDLPAKAPERFAPLSWVELKTLAAQGLDIGAHTATHPILAKLQTGLEAEIAGSKACIEQATGVAVRHFCYPNGRSIDISPAAVTLAETSGYRTAVLSESGFAGPPYNLFQLKRLGVHPDLQQTYFERYVAGYRVAI
jgi:peptidoglycan/xylan/chitin deacetylase (PgdA/CDA1 family)